MSTKERTGASLQMLDRLAANLLKAWWRAEAFLERWKGTVSEEREVEDLYLPPDVPRPRGGPYQVIVYGHAERRPNLKREQAWKMVAGLTIGFIVGFLGGAVWTHYTARDKLEERVDSLENRILRE